MYGTRGSQGFTGSTVKTGLGVSFIFEEMAEKYPHLKETRVYQALQKLKQRSGQEGGYTLQQLENMLESGGIQGSDSATVAANVALVLTATKLLLNVTNDNLNDLIQLQGSAPELAGLMDDVNRAKLFNLLLNPRADGTNGITISDPSTLAGRIVKFTQNVNYQIDDFYMDFFGDKITIQPYCTQHYMCISVEQRSNAGAFYYVKSLGQMPSGMSILVNDNSRRIVGYDSARFGHLSSVIEVQNVANVLSSYGTQTALPISPTASSLSYRDDGPLSESSLVQFCRIQKDRTNAINVPQSYGVEVRSDTVLADFYLADENVGTTGVFEQAFKTINDIQNVQRDTKVGPDPVNSRLLICADSQMGTGLQDNSPYFQWDTKVGSRLGNGEDWNSYVFSANGQGISNPFNPIAIPSYICGQNMGSLTIAECVKSGGYTDPASLTIFEAGPQFQSSALGGSAGNPEKLVQMDAEVGDILYQGMYFLSMHFGVRDGVLPTNHGFNSPTGAPWDNEPTGTQWPTSKMITCKRGWRIMEGIPYQWSGPQILPTRHDPPPGFWPSALSTLSPNPLKGFEHIFWAEIAMDCTDAYVIPINKINYGTFQQPYADPTLPAGQAPVFPDDYAFPFLGLYSPDGAGGWNLEFTFAGCTCWKMGNTTTIPPTNAGSWTYNAAGNKIQIPAGGVIPGMFDFTGNRNEETNIQGLVTPAGVTLTDKLIDWNECNVEPRISIVTKKAPFAASDMTINCKPFSAVANNVQTLPLVYKGVKTGCDTMLIKASTSNGSVNGGMMVNSNNGSMSFGGDNQGTAYLSVNNPNNFLYPPAGPFLNGTDNGGSVTAPVIPASLRNRFGSWGWQMNPNGAQANTALGGSAWATDLNGASAGYNNKGKKFKVKKLTGDGSVFTDEYFTIADAPNGEWFHLASTNNAVGTPNPPAVDTFANYMIRVSYGERQELRDDGTARVCWPAVFRIRWVVIDPVTNAIAPTIDWGDENRIPAVDGNHESNNIRNAHPWGIGYTDSVFIEIGLWRQAIVVNGVLTMAYSGEEIPEYDLPAPLAYKYFAPWRYRVSPQEDEWLKKGYLMPCLNSLDTPYTDVNIIAALNANPLGPSSFEYGRGYQSKHLLDDNGNKLTGQTCEDKKYLTTKCQWMLTGSVAALNAYPDRTKTFGQNNISYGVNQGESYLTYGQGILPNIYCVYRRSMWPNDGVIPPPNGTGAWPQARQDPDQSENLHGATIQTLTSQDFGGTPNADAPMSVEADIECMVDIGIRNSEGDVDKTGAICLVAFMIVEDQFGVTAGVDFCTTRQGKDFSKQTKINTQERPLPGKIFIPHPFGTDTASFPGNLPGYNGTYANADVPTWPDKGQLPDAYDVKWIVPSGNEPVKVNFNVKCDVSRGSGSILDASRDGTWRYACGLVPEVKRASELKNGVMAATSLYDIVDDPEARRRSNVSYCKMFKDYKMSSINRMKVCVVALSNTLCSGFVDAAQTSTSLGPLGFVDIFSKSVKIRTARGTDIAQLRQSYIVTTNSAGNKYGTTAAANILISDKTENIEIIGGVGENRTHVGDMVEMLKVIPNAKVGPMTKQAFSANK